MVTWLCVSGLVERQNSIMEELIEESCSSIVARKQEKGIKEGGLIPVPFWGAGVLFQGFLSLLSLRISS
jgi:hypothetical protein